MDAQEKIEKQLSGIGIVEPSRPVQVFVPPPSRESEGDKMLSLIQRVLYDPTVSMDRMESLMKYYDTYKADQQRLAYVEALSRLQPRLPMIDAEGRLVIYHKDDREKATKAGIAVETMEGARIIQSTPYAKFADIINAIKGPLGEEGFALDFPDMPGDQPQGAGTKLKVTARLSHRLGHVETATIVLEHDSTGSKNPVQAIQSSFSYGMRLNSRRLINFVSKAPEDQDDDGKAAGAPINEKVPAPVAAISEDQFNQLIAAMNKIGMRVSSILTWAKIDFTDKTPEADLLPLLRALPSVAFDKALRIVNQKTRDASKGAKP